MRLQNWMALLLSLLLLGTLAACGKGEGTESSSAQASSEEAVDPNWPVEIGEWTVQEQPARLVSLSPSLTGILVELGLEDRLEGVSDYCELEGAARCGTAARPTLDAIEEIDPALVFTSSPLSQEVTTRIQQMGAQVVVLPRASSIDALEELYVTAATLVGGLRDGERQGKQVFGALRKRYDRVCYAADGIADRLSGIYLREAPLMMATGDTLEGTLLQEIGIDNDAQAYTGWAYPEDQAANLYPEVIFYDQSISADYFGTTQVYSTTDAYKNGKLFAFDALAFERQGAGMFDALEQMFEQAYPGVLETTPAPDVSAQEQEDTPPAPADSQAAAPAQEESSSDGLILEPID